jgi:hypothetical protein
MVNNVETAAGKVSSSHSPTSTVTITSHSTSCVLIVLSSWLAVRLNHEDGLSLTVEKNRGDKMASTPARTDT